MPNYVLTYHGESSMPEDPAAVEAVMEEWAAWYGSMGDSLVDGGAPFGETTSIGPDGSTSSNPASLTGYTIIKADDMEAATAIARRCPVLNDGHTVQISQSIDM